jgi:hypothetical protein
MSDQDEKEVTSQPSLSEIKAEFNRLAKEVFQNDKFMYAIDKLFL